MFHRACPWVANWRRGALSGALFGVVFYFLTGVGGSAAMNQSTANVERITEADFDAGAVRSQAVVVDFYATWGAFPAKFCTPAGPARRFIYQRDAQRLRITQPVPALQHSRHSHVVFFKDGKVVDKVVGYHPPMT